MIVGGALALISALTMVKIVRAGNLNTDIGLFITMIFIIIVSALIMWLASRVLYGDKNDQIKEDNQTMEELADANINQENGQLDKEHKKIDVMVICVLISLICIVLLFILFGVYGKSFLIEMILFIIGSISMMVMGTIRGIRYKRNKPIRNYRHLRGIIGLPVAVYMLVFYTLMRILE